MILSSELLLILLHKELISDVTSGSVNGEVSSRYSAQVAIDLLFTRERGGADFVLRQFRNLSAILDELLSIFPTGQRQISDLANKLASQERGKHELKDLERIWLEVLTEFETLARELYKSSDLSASDAKKVLSLIARWEASDLADQLGESIKLSDGDLYPLDADRLEAYLRDRFVDDELEVTSFRSLPGGFGKLTYLFDAKGRDISGSMVIRRDLPRIIFDKDCHWVRNEYKIIKAISPWDIPTPDVLWLDTEHKLLAGGDFFVMRRSPGTCGGNLFGAQTQVSAGFTKALAVTLGKLHSIPQLEELSDLSESVNSRLWAMTIDRCVGEYLDNWLAVFDRENHMPSPSLVVQFNWLRDNIPIAEGSPVLIHGDLGFHNFLIENGELTTVLDWEFAHLGDPAEELAGLQNNVGDNIDWDIFMEHYRASGGPDVDISRVRFYQAWLRVRDVMTSTITMGLFSGGKLPDIKYAIIANFYVSRLLQAAQELIDGLD